MEKYQLPKEFRDKWLAALRSGKYKQTKEILGKQVEGECEYCCLGVAASLQGFEIEDLSENGELAELTKIDEEQYEQELYSDLIDAGLPMQLIVGNLPVSLIDLNDKYNKTFDEIADWVEEHTTTI